MTEHPLQSRITECCGRRTFHLVMPIDPASISTAQQKKFDPRSRRFFKNRKVAQGMNAVMSLACPFAHQVRSVIDPERPVELCMAFLYAYPKNTPKSMLVDFEPMATGADCDNRAKAPIDALALAGWWKDDRVISHLVLDKMRTTDNPRILISVSQAMKKYCLHYFTF